MKLLALLPLLLFLGCQGNPTGPSENLTESGQKFFQAYIDGKENPSGPQCEFLSRKLLQDLQGRPGNYCQEEFSSEPFPTQFVKTKIAVVKQSATRASLALAVCARAPQGWVAQPPFFFEMEKSKGRWMANSFPEPLISPPSPAEQKAGEKAMREILKNPECQNPGNWGSDQWFSYKNI